MVGNIAQRDGNYKPTILGVSSIDLLTPTTIAVNPETGAVLTELAGGVKNLIATVDNIDVTTVGVTPLFTVPTGKQLIVTSVVARVTSFTSGGKNQDAETTLGANDPTYDDYVGFNPTSMSAVVKNAQIGIQADGNVNGTPIAEPIYVSPNIFSIIVNTPSNASVEVWSIDVFGYFVGEDQVIGIPGPEGPNILKSQTWIVPDATSSFDLLGDTPLEATPIDVFPTNPDYARTINISTSNFNPNPDPATVFGTDIADSVITEDVDLSVGVTEKAFKTITKVTLPAYTDPGDVVSIGSGPSLGLDRLCAFNAVPVSASAYTDTVGVDQSTGTGSDILIFCNPTTLSLNIWHNLGIHNTTYPDGIHSLKLWFIPDM